MTDAPRQVLLVEDDRILRTNYESLLTAHRFVVHACGSKPEAIQAFADHTYDVVVLDVTLGSDYEAGFDLCHRFRSLDPLVPVIFLTEHDDEHDKISGLRLGADDYLSKTISVSYLVARLSALIRRTEALAGSKSGLRIDGSSLGAPEAAGSRIAIDDSLSRATWLGSPLNLSLTQFWILRDLVDHAGEVRSTTDLMAAAKITVQPNTIVAHIKSIREVIQDITPEFSGIKSERARGYRWMDA